ncbi:MAG: PHP-associated domain-containing protein [Chloroflexota bacterium]|nr:PHP-associated domain-containing protein [Chloroflexota bacterium]
MSEGEGEGERMERQSVVEDEPVMRIDPHVHTLASDGIDSVEAMILAGIDKGLDAIGIADHERMDAAVAGKAIAEYRGWPIEVIVGEEVSTRGGHLLGLFMTKRIRPWHSLKDSIAMIHEQGGLAIIAHPLPPYPMCASERSIRKLMDEADPIFHPDGLEGFNPTTARMRWSHKAPALAEELGIAATGGSDAHKASNVGSTVTIFKGTSAADLRTALAERDTRWEGSAYTWQDQMRMFTQQQRKNIAAITDEAGGKILRNGTGRDLGYPGGRERPVHFDRAAAGLPPEEVET